MGVPYSIQVAFNRCKIGKACHVTIVGILVENELLVRV